TELLLDEFDVAGVLSSQGEIFARAKAAEFSELMNEVRLVGIAERECQIDPIDFLRIVDVYDDVAKSLHAAEKLRRHADFVAKQIDKTPLAKIYFFGDDRARLQSRRSKS